MIGTVLCILAVVPLLTTACLGASDIVGVACVCLLFALVGVACFLFVLGGVYQAAMDRLLEEGEFTRKTNQRRASKARSALSIGSSSPPYSL